MLLYLNGLSASLSRCVVILVCCAPLCGSRSMRTLCPLRFTFLRVGACGLSKITQIYDLGTRAVAKGK